MRDEEFNDADEIKHTFTGSFRLLEKNASEDQQYLQYVGKTVFTMYKTSMLNKYGMLESIDRLTEFTITSARALPGSDYVQLTLQGNGAVYTKNITFVYQSALNDGIEGQEREDYFKSLFHLGGLDMKGVREANMSDIRRGVVRVGFTEAEVLLALGEPDGHGSSARGTVYTWIYKTFIDRTQCTVYFNTNTKRVTSVKR
jgi:hypothetical protein